MKGSFEAVDNEMIKNLKYEDIVTKPFDSNALVNSVMKNLNQEEQKVTGEFADEEPSSFPEDIIEIEPDSPGTEGISFSDLRLDLRAPAPGRNTAPQSPVLERDEILPSEEITQGTQPSKDTLQAPDTEETIQNPFNEEPLSEDLKLPSGELIDSLVPKPENGPAVQNLPAGSIKSDISDEFHERFQKVVNEDTSETLIKSSLDATKMVDRKDFDFSIDPADEVFAAKGDKLGGKATRIDDNVPVKTML
jgi:hypothetical protein